MKINIIEPKLIVEANVQKMYPSLENLEITPTTSEQTFTHENSYGYDTVTVGAIDINLQSKEVTPTINEQVISADSGYTALENVTVNAVTSAIDSNIISGNIKSGVSILGVLGTLNGVQSGDINNAITGENVTINVVGNLSNLVIYEDTTPSTAVGARFVAGIFINKVFKYGLRTNAAGSAYGVLNSKSATFSENKIIIVTDSMSRMCTGYTYKWFAW